jgi:hypothetical protein
MENPPEPPSDNAGENKRRADEQRARIRQQAARIRRLIFPPDEPGEGPADGR